MSDRAAVYEFGGYRLDPRARVLSLRDRPIALAPKSFDLLLLLVERRGRVVARDELIRELWPDTVVEEANVTFQVSTVRKALGEDGSKWIETVPKHGYRFSGPVRQMRPEENSTAEALPAAAKLPPRRAWPLIATMLAVAVALAALTPGPDAAGLGQKALTCHSHLIQLSKELCTTPLIGLASGRSAATVTVPYR